MASPSCNKQNGHRSSAHKAWYASLAGKVQKKKDRRVAEVDARTNYTPEQKEAMKKLVLAGMEAEDEAMAYCMATYGLEASDANGLLASVAVLFKLFGENLMAGLDSSDEWDNNAKSRRGQAVFDFARIIIKGYYRNVEKKK